MTTLYVAGPMRGIKHYNFPAFLDAAAELRRAGFDIVNPAERDLSNGFDPIARDMTGHEDLASEGFDLRKALAWDLQQIAEKCDGIALLPGWERSKGARAEVALAEALDLDYYLASEWAEWVAEGLA